MIKALRIIAVCLALVAMVGVSYNRGLAKGTEALRGCVDQVEETLDVLERCADRYERCVEIIE
ncbi:hypothetical protein LCGC14_2774070 [marine sediment metagenome]|uniref:Uncharacterized protein n=1 Tax=marine sediment metagenome TaxID=412755 RepID=A0A0F9B424_9ZZZZ